MAGAGSEKGTPEVVWIFRPASVPESESNEEVEEGRGRLSIPGIGPGIAGTCRDDSSGKLD
jgi:hypothetical protein